MTSAINVPARPGGVAIARAAVLVALIGGLIVALVAALNVFAPSISVVRESLSARTAAVLSPQDAVVPPLELVDFSSRTVQSDQWTVTLGDVAWNQSDAVQSAYRLNYPVTEGFEWVLLPVEISSKRSGAASFAPVDVQLIVGDIAMSHTFRTAHMHPLIRLPQEIDLGEFGPGIMRAGNVGWMVPSAARDAGTCMVKVTLAEVNAIVPCSVASGS